jgi:two-component system cell cycle response regulator CtrA
MRILLVEPDHLIAQFVEWSLRPEHFNFYTIDSGEEAVDLGKIYDYDAIVLELMLSDMDGFDVIRQLRTAKITTPILVMTGLGSVDDKVRALGLGADDYLTKPVHPTELAARIVALVRRSKGIARSIVTTGGLTVDLDLKTAAFNGVELRITGKEYEMLELLALRKGMTVTKEMFLGHLYSGRDEPEIKIIDVFICKLRRKIADASGGLNFIGTIWGRGYTLREPTAEGAGLGVHARVFVESPPLVPTLPAAGRVAA